MTVHGEREIVPSVEKAEAAKALADFTAGYTEAYRRLDPALVDRVETGALAEIGRADVTAQRAVMPKGNPRYPALELRDARFTVPKSAGWPKFFLADTLSNRDANRWLVVFTRGGAKEPWKAAYLTLHAPGTVPAFRTDGDGLAEAVPVAAGKPSGLVLEPAAVSGAYTDYLRTGKGDVFAPGGATTQLRADRARLARTPTFWTDWIDTPEKAPGFPPLALRTEDGGALVFSAAHHREKRTMAKGVRPAVTEQRTKALLSGRLTTAITLTRVSESAARVPGRATGGRVVFLNRIESLVAAKGE
ncbi:hypothetical protein [Streptomyces sp. I05A-00742]|uniref:hypothetical protein n=1 Tax=Streptomyces sp. I05A-00742 TaxID=2732853 RepID=UPI00148839A2|nr:hypothetical protein [Streptomyces sp. I05A-00742]